MCKTFTINIANLSSSQCNKIVILLGGSLREAVASSQCA